MNENTKNNDPVSSGAKSPWIDKLGDYLLDVSKYVLTGVVITSLFNNIKEQILILSCTKNTYIILLIKDSEMKFYFFLLSLFLVGSFPVPPELSSVVRNIK